MRTSLASVVADPHFRRSTKSVPHETGTRDPGLQDGPVKFSHAAFRAHLRGAGYLQNLTTANKAKPLIPGEIAVSLKVP